MAATRSILKNVGSNALGYAINVVVAFLLTPYVLERLGKPAYGLWSLVVSFVGYYGLLDVGIRSAVGHWVATWHAQRDDERVNATLSTAMALMLGVAAIAGGVTWFAGDRLPSLYAWINEARAAMGEKPLDLSAAHANPEQLRTVVWIMGAGFALSFPMALYGTVIYSVQRIAIQNVIGISQLLLRAALTWWALGAGHGLVGMACVAVGCNIVGWIAAFIAAHRVLPTLSLRFNRITRTAARDLFSYGGWNVLVNVGDTVLLYTSAFVIMGGLGDEVAVAHYVVPATTLIPYFMQLVQSVTWTFTPYFTGRWAVGAIADVRRLLLSGTRGATLLAALLAGGFCFLGEPFLRAWLDAKFSSHALFPESVRVLQILAIATLLRCVQSCGRQALFAMREVRWLGLVVLVEAAANVVLSILLVRRFGLVGVALGTLIPVCVTQGIIQPIHLLRELGVGFGTFFSGVARASLPVLATMGFADLAVRRFLADFGADGSVVGFLGGAILVAAPAAVVGTFCATTGDERRAFLARFRVARIA